MVCNQARPALRPAPILLPSRHLIFAASVPVFGPYLVETGAPSSVLGAFWVVLGTTLDLCNHHTYTRTHKCILVRQGEFLCLRVLILWVSPHC